MRVPDEKFTNIYVSKLLKQIAAAYEVSGEDKFKIRAYQNAASGVEHSTSEVRDLWEQGKLTEIAGVGASIAGHLDELFRTGKVKHFEQVLKPLPAAMFDLLGIQGIGAKTAFKLSKELPLNKNEAILGQVIKAAKEGEIRKIEGFGEQSEKDILSSIEAVKPNKESRKRMILPDASEVAQRYLDYMSKVEGIDRIEPLGSLRRKVATIGDIDFAVSTASPEEVISKFIAFPEVKEVLNQGDIKASVLLKNGVRVDLMTEKPEGFGSLLQHFTGSKDHNIALRKYALDKGMSISEHGIKFKSKVHTFSSEEKLYKFLGLDYIQPELRENSGEIESAKDHSLPKLIELSDIKGDLHSHTVFSDGKSTLDEMVAAAIKLGYEYVGISDHAPSVESRGEVEVVKIVESTRKNIEHINTSNDSIRVLYGYEVNILADSRMSLPDFVLKKLDYVIASIHTSFNQDKSQITSRMVSALKNPFVSLIGHPSGRLLNQRDSYDLDWEAFFKEALQNNKAVEINSHPERLDLPDILVKEAIKKGVKVIINTDAHSVDQFELMRYGIDIAKRGWVQKKNVLNALPRNEFLKVFLK